MYESVTRLLAPVPIQFGDATIVAVIGLAVNLLSAWLLFDDDHHHHHHDEHDVGHAHKHDSNIRAAYLHVLADALTSVLAIVALLAARFFNWVWLDPIMGIMGALFIAHWSRGLLVSAGAVLLDTVPSQNLVAAIRERLERGDDRVTDLHLWRLGPGHSGLIVTIISNRPRPRASRRRETVIISDDVLQPGRRRLTPRRLRPRRKGGDVFHPSASSTS
jgi:cation diffusion facilitator family transporter